MEHKVALVTGGARGLGRAIAERLLDNGLKVCIADIMEETGRAAAQELATKYGEERVAFECCDTSVEQQFSDAWTRCEEQLGKLDLLGGYITGSLLAFERMRSVGDDAPGVGGTVINVASIAAIKTLPFGPIYSATKSGVVGLSRALGHPLHHSLTGVKVLCLCPSLISGTPFLQCAMEKAFSPAVAKALQAAGGKIKPLTVPEVVEAFSKLLEEEVNGSVLVVEAGKEPYYSLPEIPS
ncbi:15-hydroxyprostaglandin dehydrogenase [NAD(+)] [Hyalella azteca]|uniref:15-hydroxyprostaglandin dehydrogenase [NAD(+)] n=1 Tax=Hyalella azteca TaxID=294128 RepID=A0A979FGW8_HYAAZ|nr:15-hydroxyprostaglandin dehydrogenase [NAD(+)] [Hyalella azteca]